jgi:hypothetical protein
MKNFTNLLIFLGIISFVIMGCAKSDSSSSSAASSTSTASGGDTDIDVSASSGSGALTLSSKVSLVSSNSSASATSRTAFKTASDFTSGEDINVDETETFVYERSAEAFDTANKILCWMGQTRAGQMIGQGNYKAQIDKSQCGESSGNSNAPKYEMWIVNSSRADGEPMIVKAWIPFDMDEDGTQDAVIYAQSKVYQSPSDEHPWGHFKMAFSLRQGTTTSGTEIFKGYLRTKKKKDGSNVLQFYNPQLESDGTTSQFSVAVRKKSGAGTAITTMPKMNQSRQPTGEQKSYKIAFSDKYFYKQKKVGSTTSDPVCLRRDKYLQSAWRYGLYHDNGSRLNINSGFPIKATTSGTDYYGYIGYYGLWMPPQAGVGDNSTVAKMDFSGAADQTGTNYTVRSWGGKLIKYSKNEITLGSIKNVPLSFWNDGAGVEQRIAWDGTNLKLEATRVQGQWVDNVSSNITLTKEMTRGHSLGFYSQALGGEGQLKLVYSSFGADPTAPADNSTVIFNTQTPIFPGDPAPSTFACYSRCPNPATLATGMDSERAANSIYHGKHGNWLGWSGSAFAKNSTLSESAHGRRDNHSNVSPYIYTFDNTTSGMVLQYDNGTKYNVILSTTNNGAQWGVRSGPLFDNTSANFQAIASSDNATVEPWRVREQMSTFYVWETGPKSWNKLEVLVASDNSSVKFDPPMNVKYTHSGTSSNSGKSYDNSSFYLEYGGFGNLWGLPSFCISRKNGDKVSCANDDSTRYVEDILVPAYADVTQTKDGSTNYIVKPLEIEQTMKKASSASVCTDAGTDAGLAFGDISLPDESGYTAPDMTAMPVVVGPPTVVGGVKM